MQIVATVRTLNEERHIRAYCDAYQFADKILIADGGSTDKTVEIAKTYPKVQVRDYTVKVALKDGTLRNPDGLHIQFLVDWANEEGGDWIVHQDCDQRPNLHLKQDVREILTKMPDNKDFLQVTQIYLWGRNQYFPNLSKFGSTWAQGLWAWRLSAGVKIIDKMPHYEFSFDGVESFDVNKMPERKLDIQPPYCFLHFGWDSMESTLKHVEYYRRTGLIPGMVMPNSFGGATKPLEDWMIE
jgi:hypothetical protein